MHTWEEGGQGKLPCSSRYNPDTCVMILDDLIDALTYIDIYADEHVTSASYITFTGLSHHVYCCKICCNFVLFILAMPLTIEHGPENITVAKGNCASFCCVISGTTVAPVWKINGRVHTIFTLPDRHIYSSQTLTVSNVELSDNGMKYQCTIFNVSSQIAILTVVTSIEGKWDLSYFEFRIFIVA